MAVNFRTLRRRLGPRWLTEEGESGLLGYALDLLKDGFVRRLELGLLVRFPEQDPDGTPAPDDALAAMGRDRSVLRGPSETSRSYAQRLKAWRQDAQFWGSAFGLMKDLAGYLGALPSFRIFNTHGDVFSRAADGTETYVLRESSWDWDGETARWSRFWVVIYPNGLWTTRNLGDADGATLGDGRTLGTSATKQEVRDVRHLVNSRKPDGTRCEKIIIAFDSASFDPLTPGPDGTWGNWSKNSAGVQVPARLSTARYWDGTPGA